MILVYLLVVGAAIFTLAWLVGGALRTREQLGAARAEIAGWRGLDLRLTVGGVTVIRTTLDELRYRGLTEVYADGAVPDVAGRRPVLRPLIIAQHLVITADGQGWQPSGAQLQSGQLTPVILRMEGIPLPRRTYSRVYNADLQDYAPGDDPWPTRLEDQRGGM